jgi:hypothetical protein
MPNIFMPGIERQYIPLRTRRIRTKSIFGICWMSLGSYEAMDFANTIAHIELLERIFTLPDNRPVSDGRLEGGEPEA